MPVKLDNSFASDSTWKEVADHVNQCLREYGYYNYDVFLRPATKMEQSELSDEVGVPDFIHLEFDQTECSVVSIFGVDALTGNTALTGSSPEDLARNHIVDALDMLLTGDPLDPDNEGQGRSFKVINGGKSR